MNAAGAGVPTLLPNGRIKVRAKQAAENSALVPAQTCTGALRQSITPLIASSSVNVALPPNCLRQ